MKIKEVYSVKELGQLNQRDKHFVRDNVQQNLFGGNFVHFSLISQYF